MNKTAYLLDTVLEKVARIPRAHKLEAKMHRARMREHRAAAKRLHPSLVARALGAGTPTRQNKLKDVETRSRAKADLLQSRLDQAQAKRDYKAARQQGRKFSRQSVYYLPERGAGTRGA